MSSPSRKSPSRATPPRSPSSAAHHASPSHHTTAAGSAFGSGGSQYLLQLCTPARIFAGFALFQLLMHIIDYSGLEPLLKNLVGNLINIWFLNFLCERDYVKIAWIILSLSILMLMYNFITAFANAA
jgi:hypothetical protein